MSFTDKYDVARLQLLYTFMLFSTCLGLIFLIKPFYKLVKKAKSQHKMIQEQQANDGNELDNIS